MRARNDFLESLVIGSLCVIMALLLAVSASAVGDAFGTYEAGTLSNGFAYWLAKPSAEQEKAAETGGTLFTEENASAPVAKADGSSWKQLGSRRVSAEDGRYVVVMVYGLPGNNQKVNIGFFEDSATADYVTVGENTSVVFDLGQEGRAFVKVNTPGERLVTARFKVYTTDVNPAAGYVDPNAAPEREHFGAYETGMMDNGVAYWLAKPSEDQRQTAAQSASMAWSGNYDVPPANGEGTGWKQLYPQRLYASDGKYVVLTVGKLPSTMPTVNVGLFATYDTASWVTVGADTTVIFSFGERTDAAFLRVNTAEGTSAYANFKVLTTDTNPAAGYTPPAPEAPGASDWARAEVAEAMALGFVPDELQSRYQQNITRAEFTKVALSFAAMEFGYDLAHFPEAYRDSPYGAGISQTYGDVRYADMPSPEEHVWWGTIFGIVNGRGDGTFGPEDGITRQEAAAMLSRTYDLYRGGGETPVDPAAYADMDAVADWARPCVDLMSGFGVMGGVGEETFDPNGGYTREQCMVTFLRLYKNMPVSRSRGNVTPLYSYETEKARTRQGYFESWSLWSPPYGNDAFECCYVDYGKARAPRYVLYILYSAGGCRVAEVPQERAVTATYSDDAKTMYLWYEDGSKYALDIATGQGIS